MQLIFMLTILFMSGCSRQESSFIEKKEVVFHNTSDRTQLSGTLALPAKANKAPAVLLVHGSGQHTRDLPLAIKHKPFKDLSDHLAKKTALLYCATINVERANQVGNTTASTCKILPMMLLPESVS